MAVDAASPHDDTKPLFKVFWAQIMPYVPSPTRIDSRFSPTVAVVVLAWVFGGRAEAQVGPKKVAPKSPPAAAKANDVGAEQPLDPMKRLSREFARRRAAGEQAESAVDGARTISLTPREVHPPSVVMSQEHRESCLVFLGDTMPDGSLLDGDEVEHAIGKSLGKQLTVIVFWDATHPYAIDQFEELSSDLAPFAQDGVRAIAIHVGPAPENYQQLCQEYGQAALCLLDPARQYFDKVAQSKLPRTYVLDAEGKIIWLDIEYSRTTRYELRNVLQFSLQKP